jgi:hypothetical protein
MKLWLSAVATVLLVSGGACAKKNSSQDGGDGLASMRQAYALMDKGENAEAITLLEGEIKKNPENVEARYLLATAYMGEAGLDIYALHDTFHDILFSRPLADAFLGKENETPLPELSQRGPIGLSEEEKTALQKVLERIYNVMNQVRDTVEFLKGLPDVNDKKFPMFDKALDLLDPINTGNDILLYRVFIRIVYIKNFLDYKILRDQGFGTRKWACNLEISRVRDQTVWFARHVLRAIEDFQRVYPDKLTGLTQVKDRTQKTVDVLDEIKVYILSGSVSDYLKRREPLDSLPVCEGL